MLTAVTRNCARTFSRQFSTVPRNVLVNGGNGALGQSIVSTFKAGGWNTTSMDFEENKEADNNVLFAGKDWEGNLKSLLGSLEQNQQQFGVIVNVAGGWAGGGAGDAETLSNFNTMLDMNLHSSLTAAHIACNYLSDNGLVVLTGAAPVYAGGTPGMLSYGVSKAGVHHIVKSLSEEGSGLPTGASAVCILPETIDTPGNRMAMPDADYDAWTRPSVISNCVLTWAGKDETDKCPPLTNGEFYTFKTYKKGVSVTDYCNEVEVSYRHLSN